MSAARRYYEKQWHVENVHRTAGVLDLHLVHRISGEELRVEVKGSSAEADTVEVTRWEVERSRKEACELFVVDKIEYQDTGHEADDYLCWGGRCRRGNWCADDKDLTAKTYDYNPRRRSSYMDPSLAVQPQSTDDRTDSAAGRGRQGRQRGTSVDRRTAVVFGSRYGRFVYLPISLAADSRNRGDPDADMRISGLEATGPATTLQLTQTAGCRQNGTLPCPRFAEVTVGIRLH